jgi:competence protein ComEC
VPPPGAALLAVYYGALVAVLCVRGVRARAAWAVLLAVTLALVPLRHRLPPAPAPDGVRLTMFDVGQGEALLLEAGGTRLQIDAGGAPFGGGLDIGGRVLAPALWARGVTRLDALLLTHGDPDHIGGAPSLLDFLPVGGVWEGIEVPSHGPSQALRTRAAQLGARIERLRAGDTLMHGAVRIRVLHPPEPDWERPGVRNDDSVVLEVVHGDVAILLTGDVGADVERAIAPQLTPARTRILKVAHHGSRTSTSAALLEAWRPHIALISAGRGNTFGHPAPEVVARLESIGARIYRTDRHGQITIDTDEDTVRVRTFTGRE